MGCVMCDEWVMIVSLWRSVECRSIKQRGLLGESFDDPGKRWWLGPWWAVEVIRYYWIQICLEDVVNKIFQTDWMWHVRERGFMITSRVFVWILEPCPDKTSYQNQSCSRQIQGQLSLFLRSSSGIWVPMSMPPPKAYNSQPEVRQAGNVTGGNLVGMVAAVRERESSLHL